MVSSMRSEEEFGTGYIKGKMTSKTPEADLSSEILKK